MCRPSGVHFTIGRPKLSIGRPIYMGHFGRPTVKCTSQGVWAHPLRDGRGECSGHGGAGDDALRAAAGPGAAGQNLPTGSGARTNCPSLRPRVRGFHVRGGPVKARQGPWRKLRQGSLGLPLDWDCFTVYSRVLQGEREVTIKDLLSCKFFTEARLQVRDTALWWRR